MSQAALVVGGLVGAAGVAAMAAGALAARSETAEPVEIASEGVGDVATPEGVKPPIEVAPTTFEGRLAQPFVQRVITPRLARLVGAVSSVTPADHRARIRAQLSSAGLDFTRRPEEIVTAQGAGFVIGLALAGFLWVGGVGTVPMRLALSLVLVIAGVATPMLWLSHQVDARAEAIKRDLPDTLDLLAISVEAGVGLEGALQVVTERFDSPLAEEMGRVLQEINLGLSRRDALSNLKQRAAVPELASFVSALIQADSIGMPLGTVLKVQAGDMRAKRRQWARERAAKLPVKILFPLVVCIFPAVLVVVLGPAMSQIGKALR